MKVHLELVKVLLEQVRVFNAASSFSNFEIQKYYQNEPEFNGVYSRNNLSKNKSIGTHWIALYVNAENVTYFDSFVVEHVPRKILKIIGNKNMITNIYKIREYNLIIGGYFCTGFIDFVLKGKSLLDYTNL